MCVASIELVTKLLITQPSITQSNVGWVLIRMGDVLAYNHATSDRPFHASAIGAAIRTIRACVRGVSQTCHKWTMYARIPINARS